MGKLPRDSNHSIFGFLIFEIFLIFKTGYLKVKLILSLVGVFLRRGGVYRGRCVVYHGRGGVYRGRGGVNRGRGEIYRGRSMSL